MRAAAAMAAATLLLTAGCTPAQSSYSPTTPVSPARTAIEKTIAAINQTAGTTVAAQRAVLTRLAAPDQRAKQAACPTATTTLAFDPAYRGLVKQPDGSYLLPTYITIYTGPTITGSDLATLTIRLDDGAARTTALCVS